MVGQGGSGNNWAMGYCHHGPRMREGLLSGPIRREVEACDRFDGFLLLQSMAGGTGSGLGASVAELLREEYPTATVMSQVGRWGVEERRGRKGRTEAAGALCRLMSRPGWLQAVWPYKQGEVTVQGYNTLLTVSKLTSSCDAVLVTRNDVLSDICTKLLHVKSPRFE